jgi:hypothetical protein
MKIETPPTVEEVDALIARIERIRATWSGNAGYARSLDIELWALRLLQAHILLAK